MEEFQKANLRKALNVDKYLEKDTNSNDKLQIDTKSNNKADEMKRINISLPIEDYEYLMNIKKRLGKTPTTTCSEIVREWIYLQRVKEHLR